MAEGGIKGARTLFEGGIVLRLSKDACQGEEIKMLWCCSLSHHLKCIVAVQHSHSGKIDAETLKSFLSQISVFMAPSRYCYHFHNIP
jgi:hypothetical protein